MEPARGGERGIRLAFAIWHERMTFFPIVERELIEASRRRGTYWIRLAASAVALVLGGWVMLLMHQAPPGSLAIALFVTISVAAFVYCLFIGVFRTADCLSEEKREGTLGLLFLTDLRGYDIVLGKLVATSLNAFYGILALFPVMAISLLLGGVTVGEFWRVVLVALGTLFFSLAVGMFCSAISRDERRAMVVAFIIVLFFAGGLPVLAAALEGGRLNNFIVPYLFIPSPGYAAYMAFDATFSAPAKFNYFYHSIAFTHALSWILLLMSSAIVPRTWQDKALTAAAVRRRQWIHGLHLGSPGRRNRFRARLLDRNPFCWLVSRHRTKPFAVWMFLAACGAAWSLGLIFERRDWQDEGAYVLTALIVHTVLKFWVATEASRRFSLDQQSGALELLLSTPMPVQQMIRGQMMGLERQFAAPVLVVLLADFIFLFTGPHDSDEVMLWVAGMVVLVADLITLSWLGMWRGLNSRHPNRAAVATLVRVLALPWVVFCLVLTLVALSDSLGRSSSWNNKSPIYLWIAISLGFDALFGLPAARRLVTRFREVATQRFESRSHNPGRMPT
jgi:ABC-type transport system involved in multi-copper enzyme maturation permease subunit